MTDIVERLRAQALRQDGCGEYHTAILTRTTADEIERLRAERDALLAANRDCMDHYGQARADMDALRADFTALQRAIVGDTGASAILTASALRADAERYRWLRDRSAANPRDFYSHEECWYVSRTFGNGYVENYTGNRMDAAIDAAMAQKD